jgi:hypothetical protein
MTRAAAFALLVGCAASPRADAPPAQAIYPGERPARDSMAVLLVLSPPEEDGKTLVGRIASEDTGEDFRPPIDLPFVELAPGRYRVETYYWIPRSRLVKGKLLIENLQSAAIAPVEIVVEKGRTYFIRAELRRADELSADQRSGFFPLNYAATLADPEKLRRGESEFQRLSEYVWRPHLSVLPPERARSYVGKA